MLLANNKYPKISVIIPLYNHKKYISEAIQSVLEQSFSNFELIIIDDGSTDGSSEVIKTIKDDRIRYFYQENQGTHNAINKGIFLSQGEYVSILNSDDVYHINRFEEFLKILKADPSIHAVFSHIEFIDEEGHSIGIKRGAEDNWLGYDKETSFKGEHDITLNLLGGNFLHTSSNLFCRKNVFEDIGYFSNLRYTHDYEFFLRLSYSCNVYIIEKPLLKYRFHGSNTLSENYAESIFETGLVLANFLLNYDLKTRFSENPISKAMTKFFNSINTYDADRMIMTLLFFGQWYNNKKDKLWDLISSDDPENIFKKACIDRLKKSRHMSILKANLTWQKGQTELWWRKAEELKNALEWQKGQTELWWRKAEELAVKAATLNSILNSIQSSIGWKFISGVGKILDKILPKGSKRRDLIKGLFKK